MIAPRLSLISIIQVTVTITVGSSYQWQCSLRRQGRVFTFRMFNYNVRQRMQISANRHAGRYTEYTGTCRGVTSVGVPSDVQITFGSRTGKTTIGCLLREQEKSRYAKLVQN